MRGLLRNNFYTVQQNLILAFSINLFLLFALVFWGEHLISVVISMQIFMFIANIGTAFHTDATSKWNRFELTMPIKRGDVIKVKYLFMLILLLLGVATAGFTLLVAHLTGMTITADVFEFGLAFGVFLSLATSAFMYPILLKTGMQANELILAVCATISVVIYFLLGLLVSAVGLNIGYDPNSGSVAWIAILIALMLFFASYAYSLKLYKTKDL